MDFETNARSDIRALLAAHVLYGDSGQVDEMIGLYTPKGRYQLPNGVTLNGTEEMRRGLGSAESGAAEDGWGLEYMRHHITTSHIELRDDGSAHADTYFLNINNKGLDHWGRWQDEFSRQSDESYRFTSRVVMVEGSSPQSWFRLASGLSQR